MLILPEYSGTQYFNHAKSHIASQNIGLIVGYGFRDNYNCILRYSRVELQEFDVGYNYSTIESKFKIYEQNISFSIPISFYYGKNIEFTETINFQPTLYLTAYWGDYCNITFSPKYIVFVRSLQTIVAANLNCGIDLLDKRITLIPEFGYAFTQDLQEHFGSYGFGVEYKMKLSNAHK